MAFLEETIRLQDDYGIYASVTIAQAQKEVGGMWSEGSWNGYATAEEGHNYFGIKPHNAIQEWEGEVVWDGSVIDHRGQWAAFDDEVQCLRDRAHMLLDMGAYAEVAATCHGQGSAEEQMLALAASPWCEGGYGDLAQIRDRYGLSWLDDVTSKTLAQALLARADADSVVGRAYSMIGQATYVWGACDAQSRHFDCSGFVSWCLTGESSRLGTTETFMSWPEAADPEAGDLCVYSNAQGGGVGHCGIYIGDGMMIDCSEGVAIRPVDPRMSYHRSDG